MCGIAGWIEFSPLSAERRITLGMELLQSIQERGMDAVGVCTFGSEPHTWKAKGTVGDHGASVVSALGRPGSVVLLHTRAATTGTEDDNENNHPLTFGPLTGVHNGIINNHEMLKQTYGGKAEVDSLAIWSTISGASGDSMPEKIAAGLKHVDGFLSCGMVNQGEPNTLYIFTRGSRSLVVGLHIDQSILVFASTATALYAAARKVFGLHGNLFPQNTAIDLDKSGLRASGPDRSLRSFSVPDGPQPTYTYAAPTRIDWGWDWGDYRRGWKNPLDTAASLGRAWDKAKRIAKNIEIRRNSRRVEKTFQKLLQGGPLPPGMRPMCGEPVRTWYIYAMLENASIVPLWESASVGMENWRPAYYNKAVGILESVEDCHLSGTPDREWLV